MGDKRIEAVEHFYKGSDYAFTCTFDTFNERIRVDVYDGSVQEVIAHIQEVFTSEYSKCIVKVKSEDVSSFLSIGYTYEGKIRFYFSGSDAHLMTKYRTNWRRNSESWVDEEKLLKAVQNKPHTSLKGNPPMRIGIESDAEALAKLYQTVFSVYPTPMDDPSYIKKAMKSDTIFYVMEDQGIIKSAASAEVNRTYRNAEMTDCATLPEYRKGGTMRHLILALETELLKQEVYYAYSIARSLSFGMNAVFHQLHYEYGGRLVNNVKIYKDWENMNLWSKTLLRSAE
ncbi:putative beta-lysine N-acetyltransferase [Guptibacillus hwajinpoensis]|uniref:putative beta-lysine N-acetyltransferase n=1 Tax=Guptibacillus hwajinpoensis TaxID=208199 RepID=UPI00384ED1E4